jgi:hypothetical protein
MRNWNWTLFLLSLIIFEGFYIVFYFGKNIKKMQKGKYTGIKMISPADFFSLFAST